MAKLANFPKPEEGFTGSEIYFQDKFDEFDWATRYNRMKPKEGFKQVWRDIKDSTKMEEGEWGKIPPIPPALLKSGLGFILKQLAGGKFNEGRRNFLEFFAKPSKPTKLKNELLYNKIKKKSDNLTMKILQEMSKYYTKHAEGGIAGMLGEPRSGYQGGGYLDYWKMVQDKYYEVKEIDPEKFGNMSIQDFAKEYFPRPGQAEGGRIGLKKGGPPFYIFPDGLEWMQELLDEMDEEKKRREGFDTLEDWNPKDPTYHAEGGRIGLAGGGDPRSLLLSWLIKQGPKAWKWINKPGNNPLDLYKKYLKSVKDRTLKANESGKFTDLPLETLAIGGVGGLIANQFKKKMKGMNEDSVIKYDIFGNERKAQGGRIGLAGGMTPSESWMRNFFFSEKGEKYENSMSFKQFQIGPGIDLWNRHIGKAKGGRIGYENGGPTEQEDYDAYVAEKEGAGEEYMDFEMWKQFQLFDWGKAEGGRIGFKDGEGIMSRVGDMVDARNVPYYSGKALQGLVNSAETLSKFPFAAGELGSKLLQQPPKKEMFMEAIENITPGSWSENLGLTSLVEGMGEKRPKDAQTVGGILGLGTEIAVPTGGAFKAGQLLLNKASKAMGKVKDGKTLNKLVEDKISDSGQSRRDFMSLVGASGLAAGLKWLGLGGILKTATKVKPSDDVVMRLRTFIDDSDVDTEWGPVAQGQWGGVFDVEGLSKAAQKTLVGIMKDVKSTRRYPEKTMEKIRDGSKKHLPPSVDFYDDILPEDSSYILEALQKAGHKVKFEHVPDMGGWSVDDILSKFKNDPMYKGTKEGAEKYKKFKEKTDKWSARKKEEYHTDITDDYGHHHNPDVEDFFDTFYGVEKAEGGRIGFDEGGWTQEDFDKYLQDRKKRDKENRKQDFLDDFEEWKKWKETEGGTLDWAAEGGRIGLQTGGPPITLQRPMFNDGGLTKTIPPKRGPDPQGLPSALYNGIMRPRSY